MGPQRPHEGHRPISQRRNWSQAPRPRAPQPRPGASSTQGQAATTWEPAGAPGHSRRARSFTQVPS